MAWITAAIFTASHTCSLVRPSSRTVLSWATAQCSQPLIVDTASDHSSKSAFSTPGFEMMFMRRPNFTWA